MYAVTKQGGPIYVCHADSGGVNFRNAMKDSKWELKQCIIWVKNSFILGRQDYQWRHEPILYGWKPGAPHCWYGDRKTSTVLNNEDCISVKEIQDGYQVIVNIDNKNIILKVPSYEVQKNGDDTDKTIWFINKPLRNAEHPTMKPVKISGRAIENSSDKGNIVLDAFGGSGSTLISAEQLNRVCYIMELDEKYCDVIIKRWEELTGDKAKLLKKGVVICPKQEGHQADPRNLRH
jgi:DNA modification methylase